MSSFRTLLPATIALALMLAASPAAWAQDFAPSLPQDMAGNTASAPIGDDESGGVGNVHFQSNIDSARNISITHDVQVTNLINGQSRAYGLAGANVLAEMNDNASFAADYAARVKANADAISNWASSLAH